MTSEHPCRRLLLVAPWMLLLRGAGHLRVLEDRQTPAVGYRVPPALFGLTPQEIRGIRDTLTVVDLSHHHNGTTGFHHDLLSPGTDRNQGESTGGKTNDVIVSARVARRPGSRATTQTRMCRITATRLSVPGMREIMASKPMLTGAGLVVVTIAVNPRGDEAEVQALAGERQSPCVVFALRVLLTAVKSLPIIRLALELVPSGRGTKAMTRALREAMDVFMAGSSTVMACYQGLEILGT